MASPIVSTNPFSRLWELARRRRTIGRYLKLLPRCLIEDYGHRGPYTPGQVLTSIRRHKISSSRYAEYAVALFCEPAQLRQLQQNDSTAPDYAARRRDLGQAYFGGDIDFSLSDVIRSSAEHGGGGYETAHSGEVGGHHGGDGGGGGHH